jgi:hypothetical protein
MLFQRDAIKNLISRVKDPLFSRRLLLSFNIWILSYQLKNPKDNKIGVDHVPGGRKYFPNLKLHEVTKTNFVRLLSY